MFVAWRGTTILQISLFVVVHTGAFLLFNRAACVVFVVFLLDVHDYILIKEWVSFFLGSWDMNRSAEQTNRTRTAKRFSCDLFVPHCDSYPMNREKKTLIPYIYNASNKDPF